MIRVFNHYFPRRAIIHMLFDFALILLAVGSAVMARTQQPQLLLSVLVIGVLSFAICVFIINTASGLYRQAHNRSLHQSVARAFLALLLALPAAYGIFSLTPASIADTGAIKLAAMIGVAAVLVHRVYAAHAASQTRLRSKVLIFGSGAAAQLIGKTIRTADPHADVVGYFPGPNEPNPVVPRSQLLSGDKSLTSTALELNVDEIVVALTERRGGSMPLRDLLDCKLHQIRVCDTATYFEKTLGQIKLDYTYAGWLIFGDGFRQGYLRTIFKRLYDILCALVLLMLAAPLMLMAALLISLESTGPVLYRQTRVGRNGKNFNVIKFRSMRADAEHDGKPRWATEKDDRVTKVGSVMRKYRIDELPQLINVLKGEMSLVGPRPERPFFVDQFTSDIPYYAVRHSVKPGVTGWAQVRYHYGSSVEDCQEKLQYDLYYVKNHSLFLDLVILFETVIVVVMGKGAR